MANTVERPKCKKWYDSNQSNTCPFCGFKAEAYDHVNVQVTVRSSAKALVEVIANSLIHPKMVTVIDRGTGSFVARFTPEQFESERAKYPADRYIIS